MVNRKIHNYEVKKEILELYEKGWSPSEIILAFKGSNKTDKQVENFVMNTLKPTFS